MSGARCGAHRRRALTAARSLFRALSRAPRPTFSTLACLRASRLVPPGAAPWTCPVIGDRVNDGLPPTRRPASDFSQGTLPASPATCGAAWSCVLDALKTPTINIHIHCACLIHASHTDLLQVFSLLVTPPGMSRERPWRALAFELLFALLRVRSR